MIFDKLDKREDESVEEYALRQKFEVQMFLLYLIIFGMLVIQYLLNNYV